MNGLISFKIYLLELGIFKILENRHIINDKF